MVMIRIRTFVLTGVLCLSGCAGISSMNESMQGSFQGFTSSIKKGWIEEEEEEEEWIKQAGIEARGDRPVETQNDPLDFLKSSKTRSIERNLGLR